LFCSLFPADDGVTANQKKLQAQTSDTQIPSVRFNDQTQGVYYLAWLLTLNKKHSHVEPSIHSTDSTFFYDETAVAKHFWPSK